MKLTVISGRSGSGKSTALHVLEDAGFNCIDNLPVGLLPTLVEHAETGTAACAVSIDARNLPHDLVRFPEILASLRSRSELGLDVEIIYLDADLTTLVRRFSETRRRHPLTGRHTTLPEALAVESELLQPIASRADLVIDTTQLSHHELRSLIGERVARRSGSQNIALTLMSFGYSGGVPVDADLVFDVRCLPNPHWIPHLQAQSGQDGPVQVWLSEQPEVDAMLGDLQRFLERWLPAYAHSNRSYMTIAIGCTGGKHRSVYLCERLAARFQPDHPDVLVRHRDLR